MNKLDALIDACLTPSIMLKNARAIRRILEAVREDMRYAEKECAARVKLNRDCVARHGRGQRCGDCPRAYLADTFVVLEAMK